MAPNFDVVSTLSRAAQRDSIPRVKGKLRVVKQAIQRTVKKFWGPRHRSEGLGNDLDVIDLLCTASDLRGQVQGLMLDFRDSLAEIAKYRKGIARLNAIKADIQDRVHKATALAGAVVISNQDVSRGRGVVVELIFAYSCATCIQIIISFRSSTHTHVVICDEFCMIWDFE